MKVKVKQASAGVGQKWDIPKIKSREEWAANCADEFFSLSTKYRTKEHLVKIILETKYTKK